MRLLIDHEEFKTAWAATGSAAAATARVFAAATADSWDLSEDEYRSYLEWKQPKDDAIKEALSLLGAAGFSKDKPLKFTLSGANGNAYQTAARRNWRRRSSSATARACVDPDIKYYRDHATWTDGPGAAATSSTTSAGTTSGGTDPDTYFTSTYKTGGGRNYGKMSDPQLDQMIAKQRTIFDEAERKKAVRDIIVYMIDHCPYGSAEPYYILYATPPDIHGFPPQGPTFKWGDHYEDVWVTR